MYVLDLYQLQTIDVGKEKKKNSRLEEEANAQFPLLLSLPRLPPMKLTALV